MGRLIRKILPDPDGESPLTSPSYQYAYNAAGHLVAETDPLGNVTQYEYDARGRLIRTLQPDPDGEGPLASPVLRQDYDAAGRLSHLLDPLGHITEYAYDNADRQTAVFHGAVVDDQTAGYSEPAGTWTDGPPGFEGDSRIHPTVTGTPTAVATWTFEHLMPGMSYEVYVTWQADPTNAPDAPFAIYAGDTSGDPLATVLVDQSQDPGELGQTRPLLGRDFFKLGVFTITDPTLIVQLANSSAAPDIHVIADAAFLRLASPLSQTVYDNAGRVIHTVDALGNVTSYEYDAAGRMTQYVNSIDGTADYTHDATGQLTAADYDYQDDESYQYDENGNRITANGSTYTTGTNNRLLSDGTYRYQYDAEGNRTARFIDANQNGQLDAGDTDITEYTCDHRNRLVKVEHPATYAPAVDRVIENAYDYANRWVRKRLDADGHGHTDQRRIFAYDANQIVLDFWRNNSQNLQIGHLRQRYLWGPAVDQILAEEAVDGGTDDLVQWTLTDHLNTVRDIAKYDPGTEMTTVVNHVVYDAFGRVTSESNPAVDSLFLFTARPMDPDTGLQNNLNRSDDPAVTRWLSEDPIGFAAGDRNLCGYVLNHPANSKDPSGLKLVLCRDTDAGVEKWITVPDIWNGGDPCRLKFGSSWREVSSSSDQTSIKSICASIEARCQECSRRCCEKAMAKFLNAVNETWILNICGLPIGPDTCQRWVFDLESRLPNFGLGDPCIKSAGIQTFKLKGGVLSPRHVTYKVEFCDGSVVYADNGAWGGRDHIFLPGAIPDYATTE